MTLLSMNELMRESSKEARFTYILHVFVLMKIREHFPSVSVDSWSLREKKDAAKTHAMYVNVSTASCLFRVLLNLSLCVIMNGINCTCGTLQDGETSVFLCKPGTFSLLNCKIKTSRCYNRERETFRL